MPYYNLLDLLSLLFLYRKGSCPPQLERVITPCYFTCDASSRVLRRCSLVSAAWALPTIPSIQPSGTHLSGLVTTKLWAAVRPCASLQAASAARA
jgi:hypothetical protein